MMGRSAMGSLESFPGLDARNHLRPGQPATKPPRTGGGGSAIYESGIRQAPAMEKMASLLADAEIERYSVVSMFSGCGGMDLGFVGGFPFGSRYFDRLPFEIVWANDSNKAACQTYEQNLRHSIHCGCVNDFFDTLPKRADVVLGGFPCQDVSIIGKGSAEHGERTILYKVMIEAIRQIRPNVFVAENVPGVYSRRAFYKQMAADFASLTDYRVAEHVIVASDYGVPQRRKRLFIVGVRGDKPFVAPKPESYEITAGEALSDLEEWAEDASIGHIWSKAAVSPEQGNRRLKRDVPATTIRAEHHGNIQWHYSLPRRISLREAARLQSFPDAFSFAGGMRQTERQIGNAVPPVLAWHIARSVGDWLDAGRI